MNRLPCSKRTNQSLLSSDFLLLRKPILTSSAPGSAFPWAIQKYSYFRGIALLLTQRLATAGC